MVLSKLTGPIGTQVTSWDTHSAEKNISVQCDLPLNSYRYSCLFLFSLCLMMRLHSVCFLSPTGAFGMANSFRVKVVQVLILLPIMYDLRQVTLMVPSSCSCRGFNEFILGKISGSKINILYSISLLILLLISYKTMSNTSNHPKSQFHYQWSPFQLQCKLQSSSFIQQTRMEQVRHYEDCSKQDKNCSCFPKTFDLMGETRLPVWRAEPMIWGTTLLQGSFPWGNYI